MNSYKKIKLGDREIIEPVDMPKGTRVLLAELLAQNRLILEENCRTIRSMSQPMVVIAEDPK